MRVLIVRLGSMGDVLHALPAVAALRAAQPGAYIGWAIERRWTPFLHSGWPTLTDFGRLGGRSPQQPLVDRVHIVDTLGWRRAPFSDATWADVRNTFRDLRAERYDVAIDFQGSIKSALVAQFSAATSRIGFAQPREKPATMFYTHLVQPTARHIIDQNLELLSSVVPLRTPAPPAVEAFSPRTPAPPAVDLLPSDPAAESKIDALWDRLPSAGPTKRIAILNPGAGWPAKQWPSPRYAEVARALHHDGFSSFVNYGPSEKPLALEVEAASGGTATPISCSLPELIALTRRASLFIGSDTGPMHLAALLGVPVVALFGPTDPARNGPYSLTGTRSKIENQRSKTIVVLRHPASRTTTTHSSTPDPGLLQITTADVISAARSLVDPAALSRVDPESPGPNPEGCS